MITKTGKKGSHFLKFGAGWELLFGLLRLKKGKAIGDLYEDLLNSALLV